MARRPVPNRLSGVVPARSQAEGQLRRAAGWFSWRSVVLTAAIAQLHANAEESARKAGCAKLEKCGEQQRLVRKSQYPATLWKEGRSPVCATSVLIKRLDVRNRPGACQLPRQFVY